MILALAFLGPPSPCKRRSFALWASSEKRRRLWMNPYSPVRPDWSSVSPFRSLTLTARSVSSVDLLIKPTDDGQ